MAATIDIVRRTVFGDQKVTVADITFDDSYPTGGEAIDLSLLGLSGVNFVWAPPTDGYLLQYDYANDKLLAYWPTTDATPPAAGEEVASTTDLDALTVRCMFYGY